ncbi:putative nucleoside transporter YegT [Planctomycetes bacterium LzC2]|uniref:Nucleoside transporter YegT n=1 Tax=Alienimonas chondri TaxID=2681879 RepID=A0ABX1VC03_9PLAN|nr:MFS transporter [Alienimonas chondri]NNJ25589.1 putative nucleoside transporter YegT [Alienimonas chondri]
MRLSVLWMLQWGITGALLTYLPLYFESRGLSRGQLGSLFAVAAVGLWVAPIVVGQLCDRLIGAEKYLAVAHFFGGVTLLAVPFAADIFSVTGEGFWFLIATVGLFSALYFPTLPVVSAVTFRHLPDPDSQFGRVRLWGTVGWVLSGLFVSVWLGQREAMQWLSRNSPALRDSLEHADSLLRRLAPVDEADCFRIAAVLSFALSSFCAWLPRSPPPTPTSGRFAPLQTLGLLKDKQFSLLIAASFALSLIIPVYTLEVPALLVRDGYDPDWVPAVMTVGQLSEFPALLLLGLCLKRLGVTATFTIGVAAWALRFLLLAVTDATGPVLAGLALHGVCHVFLIVAVQLYVDSRCPKDLRASGQNLFAVVTVGVGMPLGFLLSGTLSEWASGGAEAPSRLLFLAAAIAVSVVLVPVWMVGRRRGRVEAT